MNTNRTVKCKYSNIVAVVEPNNYFVFFPTLTSTFVEATENECINERTHGTYISTKTDNPCSAVSLGELSCLLLLRRQD